MAKTKRNLNTTNNTTIIKKQDPELDFLTENIVKRATLSFLKSYYKFRPRKHKEPTIASLDMRAAGGIIADGFYSYKQPDGKSFLSTFEATSYYTKKEIVYTPQKQLLLFDGMAVSSVFGAFFFSYGYFYNHFTVKDIGVFATTSLVGLSIFASMLLYYLIARAFSRYRYIYAVEQFKNYHAEEQWISIAHDVFANPEDKNLRELKNQCVYNGFGLISINKNLEPKLLITPARKEIFDGKRKKRKFKSKTKQPTIPKNKYTKWWHKLSDKIPVQPGGNLSLSRFAEDFTKQMLVSGIAMALIGGILWEEIKDADLIVTDKDDHQENLAVISTNTVPEEKGFIVDSNYINDEKKLPQEHHWWEFSGELNLKEEENDELAEIDSILTEKSVASNQIEVFLTNPNGGYIEYLCERFADFERPKFVLVEGLYSDFESVRNQIQIYNDKGFTANALWLGCIYPKRKDYALFFNVLYNFENEALDDLADVMATAKYANISLDNLEIRKLQQPDANSKK